MKRRSVGVWLVNAAIMLCGGALLAADVSTSSARDIVARAQAAAGGATWIHPRTLLMRGHAVFYTSQGVERHERYDMWRVYPVQKGSAHAADGKVRIESWLNGERVRLVTSTVSVPTRSRGLSRPLKRTSNGRRISVSA